jgi:hypothetical protein
MAKGYATFVLVLALLTGAGLFYERDVRDPTEGGTLPTPETIGPDWYVAVDDDLIHWDDYVHYTGYGPAIANARMADVMIVGNSRAQFSFDPPMIAKYGQEHSLRFYDMGFGFGESTHFTELIFDRHDIRPPVVVVMVDIFPYDTFTDSLSPFAQSIVDKGTWGANRTVYSHMWMNMLQLPLQHLFPYFHSNNLRTILYRSWTTGFWGRQLVYQTPGAFPGPTPVDERPPGIREIEIAKAQAFVQRMQARGSQVIFSWVPTPATPRAAAQDLADAAHVPLIAPDLDLATLRSVDGSHLDVEGSQRYTEQFEAQLTPMLRRLLPGKVQ